MKPILLLACSALLCLAASATDQSMAEVPSLTTPPPSPRDATAAASVPEPTTMLLAGIGGIILLVFAIRRK